MSANPWCFDKTEPLNKLSTAAEAFISEIENIHSQVDSTEWEQIVEPMNLKANGLDKFLIRPSVVYNSDWWNLSDPNCWFEAREILSKYDISAELVELEAIAKAYTGTYDPAAAALSRDFISVNIAGRFGLATTQFPGFTLGQIDRAAYRIYDAQDLSKSDAALETWFTKTIDVIIRLESKLNSIPCPSIDYFKGLYERAVIQLAQKEIDRQVEQTAKDLFSNLTTTEMGQLNTLLDKVRT